MSDFVPMHGLHRRAYRYRVPGETRGFDHGVLGPPPARGVRPELGAATVAEEDLAQTAAAAHAERVAWTRERTARRQAGTLHTAKA